MLALEINFTARRLKHLHGEVRDACASVSRIWEYMGVNTPVRQGPVSLRVDDERACELLIQRLEMAWRRRDRSRYP